MSCAEGYIPLSSVPDDTSPPPIPVVTTLSTLLISAAHTKYGRQINLLDTPASQASIDNFLANTNIRVVLLGDLPQEIRRIAVDVSKKEIQNFSSEKDESVLTIDRPVGHLKSRSFEFFTTSGLVCGTAADLGAKVITLGLSGVHPQVAGTHSTVAVQQASSMNQFFCFDYTHQEKISVPPGRTVTVVITTFAVKYALGYTLEFSIPRSWYVPIRYRTKFQQLFCECCTSPGCVFASELLCTLPNFREDDAWVYFTQKGTLTWVNESSKIEKVEK